MENMFGKNLDNTMSKFVETQEKLIKGIDTLMNVNYSGSDATPKELVFSQDKMKLFHYVPKVKDPNKVPLLIVYALVNKQYMMDLQHDKSLIRNLLEGGQDIYIIDWGYPTQEDRYITLEDYIEGYIDECVEYIKKAHNIEKINILGVCQGGTFSLIYSALHPDKIKNIVSLVTPLDFSTDDGLLFKWGKHLNIDKVVDAYGVVPGDFMNFGFVMLKPYDLMIDKYISVIDDLDDPEKIANFLRMEKWIFDSPAQVGEALRQFIKDMYHDNKLYKGEFELGGKKVDLKNITAPILVILGQKDNQVPPAATRPIIEAVGSKDKELVEYPTGHIGIFVSGRSQKEVGPKINDFLNARVK